jgi:ADP-ribosylglycohydrolase
LGIALAALLLTCGEDPAETILICCKIGRDSDTIARVAGGLVGTLGGASCIPAEWADYVLARNRWMLLEEKAEQLAAVIDRRLRRDVLDRQAVIEGRL